MRKDCIFRLSMVYLSTSSNTLPLTTVQRARLTRSSISNILLALDIGDGCRQMPFTDSQLQPVDSLTCLNKYTNTISTYYLDNGNIPQYSLTFSLFYFADFNPIQEMIHLSIPRHMRRFCASLVMFGTSILVMLYLPSRIIKKLLPNFLPYQTSQAS